jgi:hypothetical protein
MHQKCVLGFNSASVSALVLSISQKSFKPPNGHELVHVPVDWVQKIFEMLRFIAVLEKRNIISNILERDSLII